MAQKGELMNKADIDAIIKLFATYITEPLDFGGIKSIDNTKMRLEYRITITKL